MRRVHDIARASRDKLLVMTRIPQAPAASRILIVDDHAVVRMSFRRLLLAHTRFMVAGEAGSAAEALEALRNDAYNIVLLDLSLPDGSGIDVLRRIRARYPETKVLVISGLPEEEYGVNMLRAGASGFLSKTCSKEDLINAIDTVAAGRRYIGPHLADLLSQSPDALIDKPLHEQLSEREYQVFHQLARGKAVTEISESLSIDVKTVIVYRSRLMGKMGLRTHTEMARYAAKNGLIELSP